jgi:hypothetical protein
VFNTPVVELLPISSASVYSLLQREDPLLPILGEQMDSFLSKLASRFLQVSIIKTAKKDFSSVNYMEKEKQLPGNAQ